MFKTLQAVFLYSARQRLIGALLLLCCSGSALAQPLQMVAQPIFPPEQAQLVYQPLADYLTEQLGREVQLNIPRNFQEHWLAIKGGAVVDLAVEEAPLTDFRVNYMNFVPLVRGQNSVSYSLAVLDPAYTDRNDLVGLPVASMPAPSTGYLVLARWYNNPLSQAQIISNSTSWDDAVQQIWSGVVEAAIIPTRLAQDYPQFNIIDTSVEMPALAISASPELDDELRQSIINALLALNDDESNYNIIDELNVQGLETVSPNEYRGYAEWLRAISSSGF